MTSVVHPLLHQLLKVNGIYDQLQPDATAGASTRRPRQSLDQLSPLLATLSQSALQNIAETLLAAINQELNQLAPTTPAGSDSATPIVQGEYNDLGPLAQQFALHKFAFDQHAIISVTDKVGRIIYVNQQFCDRSGYSQQELLGSFHRFAQSSEYPSDYYQSLWATVKRGDTWQGEIKNLTRSGETYWVFATIVPILNADGEPVQFISVRTDITDRKMISRQLERERQFLDRLADTVGDGIFATNEAGECIFFNVEAERILGWSREQMLGKPIAEHIFSPQPHAINEAITQGLARSQDTFMAQSNGTAIAVDIRTSALSWSRNSKGAVTVFRDISLRRKAELEREKALKKAENATKAKSQFLANMSHEIRTPMNAIIGMSYLALDTPLDKQQTHYVDSIQHSAHNLLGIINDILDFSRIEAGQLKVESTPFSLDTVLAEIHELNGVKAQEKDIGFYIARDFNIPDGLIGDSLRLNQILTNLVSNAIKFTHQGQVTLNISQHFGSHPDLSQQPSPYLYLVFTIQDTGIGIDQNYLKQLFTPFSQADTSTTRQYGGTGLGLTISQQLISLLDGHIEVTSEVGQGSCFKVTIPFEQAELSSELTSAHTALSQTATQLLVFSHQPRQRQCNDALVQQGIHSTGVLASHGQHLQPYELSQYQAALLDNSLSNDEAYGIATKTAPHLAVPGIIFYANTLTPINHPRAQGLSLFTPKNLARQLAKQLNHDDLPQQQSLSSQFLCLSNDLPNAKILLVEDNQLNVEVAKAMLEALGMTVICAYDGFEAIERFQADDIDLVLMDLQMPELDGFATSAKIRHLKGGDQVPIVALTAHAMSGDREKSLSHGMNDYLAKPIDPKQLQACLAAWLPSAPQGPAQTDQPTEVRTMPIDALRHLDPHLNLEEGLYRTANNLPLYQSLLARFVSTHKESANLLRQHCELTEFEQGTLLIHTVKGVAGNLGAMALFNIANTIEGLLNQQQLPQQAQLDAYSAELACVCNAIHEALSHFETEQNPTNTPLLAAPKLSTLLTDLKVLVECGDVECLSYLEYLQFHSDTQPPPTSLHLIRLIKWVEEFDFEQAEAEISAIMALPEHTHNPQDSA